MIQELKKDHLTADFDKNYGRLGFDGGRLAQLKMTPSYFALKFLGETEWIQTETSIEIEDERVYVVHVVDTDITIIRGPPLDIDATNVSPYRLLPPSPLKSRRNSQLHDINLFIARDKPILYAYRTSSNVSTDLLFTRILSNIDQNNIRRMVSKRTRDTSYDVYFKETVDGVSNETACVSRQFYDDVKRIYGVDGEERHHVSIYRNYGHGHGTRVFTDHLNVVDNAFQVGPRYVPRNKQEYGISHGPAMVMCKMEYRQASQEEKQLATQLQYIGDTFLYNSESKFDKAFTLWKKTLTKEIADGVKICLTRVFDLTPQHPISAFDEKNGKIYSPFNPPETSYYQVYLRIAPTISSMSFISRVLRVGFPELPPPNWLNKRKKLRF